jgi:hypothetical protein
MGRSDTMAETADRLCASSRRAYQNPYEAIDWPDVVERPAWFTSPELISLYATPAWDALGDDERRELSFWEAVNFYSLNLHGEQALMEGLARRLHQPGLEEVTDYLHHFLDEENKHSIWFGTFCRRYAGRVYPDRTLSFAGEPAFARDHAPGEDDVLFFARVAIFEELVDRYNSAMGRDERLLPIARQINARHHAEETRHLVFGRHVVEHLWARHRPGWSDETVEGVRVHLAGYLVSTWRAYYNPDAYRDAGLLEPHALARQTWEHPATAEHRRNVSGKALGWLADLGVFDVGAVELGARR